MKHADSYASMSQPALYTFLFPYNHLRLCLLDLYEIQDTANYWTIILDAANFQGPAMYMSNWFWDMRTNWHPQSASWSDPRNLIGYIAEGFEGTVGAFSATDTATGDVYYRTTEWALPKDRDFATSKGATINTAHSEYYTDWATVALEPMLAGTGSSETQTPAAFRARAMAERTKPSCNIAQEWSLGRLDMEQQGVEVNTVRRDTLVTFLSCLALALPLFLPLHSNLLIIF